MDDKRAIMSIVLAIVENAGGQGSQVYGDIWTM